MPEKSSTSLQYLIDAVSILGKINMAALEAGHFPKDNTNTATCFTGKTAVVFAFQLERQLKAIKIWPSASNEDLRKRYAITEKHLNRVGLQYFMRTFYLKEAIDLKGVSYDALLMDWVGRQDVKAYIYSNIDQKQNIHALAEKILLMHKALNREGISHGHFHPGNIYVDANNELKLIGYDNLFILGEMIADEGEQSYPDYSHPSGKQKGAKADYFAALILYLGAKAIAHDPVLWGRYKVGFQEGFIFNAIDFSDIKNAAVYKYLRKIQSPEIDRLLDVLVIYCEEKDPSNLKPFYSYLEKKSGSDLYPFTGSNRPYQPDVVSAVLPAVTDGAEKSASIDSCPVNPLPEDSSVSNVPADPLVFQEWQPVIENQLPSGTENKKAIGKQVDIQTVPRIKKRFFIGIVFICLLLVAAGYLLGNLGDRLNNSHSIPIESRTGESQDTMTQKPVVIKDPASPATTSEQSVDLSAADSNNLPRPSGKNQKNEITVATKANATAISNSTANSSTAKKQNQKERQDAGSFTIGAAPKE